jgi:hypothetical protein
MLYYALLAADMLYYNRGNCLIIQNHWLPSFTSCWHALLAADMLH